MFLYQNKKIRDTVTIGAVNYSLAWITQASPTQLSSLGITNVSDPVLPDPNIYTWTENDNGSLTITPLSQEIRNERKAANIDALWQAAHDYEYASINGSAVGLVTLGLLRNLPKCVAVSQWVSLIWTLYYQRKANVTYVFDPNSLDFSVVGPMPHSIPELMAEVGY